MKHLIKLAAVLITGLCLLSLNACSTVEGIGKDIQKAGQSIEQEAKKNK